MSEPPRIKMINLTRRHVWLVDDDELVPITNFLDYLGKEMAIDPDRGILPTYLVAGPMKSGQWLTVDMRCFEALQPN